VHRINAAHVKLAARDTPGVVPQQPWWRRLWPKRPSARPTGLFTDSELRTPARSKL
jgi:hypothetical protein